MQFFPITCTYTGISIRGLIALWEYMETQLGIDPSCVWNKIQDLVIKTMMR